MNFKRLSAELAGEKDKTIQQLRTRLTDQEEHLSTVLHEVRCLFVCSCCDIIVVGVLYALEVNVLCFQPCLCLSAVTCLSGLCLVAVPVVDSTISSFLDNMLSFTGVVAKCGRTVAMALVEGRGL